MIQQGCLFPIINKDGLGCKPDGWTGPVVPSLVTAHCGKISNRCPPPGHPRATTGTPRGCTTGTSKGHHLGHPEATTWIPKGHHWDTQGPPLGHSTATTGTLKGHYLDTQGPLLGHPRSTTGSPKGCTGSLNGCPWVTQGLSQPTDCSGHISVYQQLATTGSLGWVGSCPVYVT